MSRTRYPLAAVCFLALAMPARATAARAQARSPSSPPPPIGSAGQLPPAAQPDPLHQSGSNVTISLLTMGNGEQVWELFGHNAIWIHDNLTNRDTVFNWGVFSFRQPHFIARFLKGTMLYAMGGETLDTLLMNYRYWNRSVVAQELELTPAQKDSILVAIQRNALPENINYRYDYYRDNCSTRVRDILDHALGGPLSVQASGLTDATYRWHTLRLMQGSMPIMLGVDIGLGRPADVKLTKWQEMFLPRKLHDFVAKARVADSTGTMRPLVRSERVLFQASRDPEPAEPPELGLWLLFGGVIIAAIMTTLGFMATPLHTFMRGAAVVVSVAWALTAGLLGTVLVLLWTVTDHVFAHSNENLLLLNPLWLGLVVMLPVYLWSGRWESATRRLISVISVFALIALLLHLLGVSRQDNLPVIGLVLPPTLGILAMSVRSHWAPVPRRVPPPRRRQA